MKNDEILDRWHAAEQAYESASVEEKPSALYRKMATEQQAVERFGCGPHMIAYRTRFPRD